MFIERGAGAKCVIVPPCITDFQIDFDALEQVLSEHTKAVVVNSPNNPSGAVYSEQTVQQLAGLVALKRKSSTGTPSTWYRMSLTERSYMMAYRCRLSRPIMMTQLYAIPIPSRYRCRASVSAMCWFRRRQPTVLTCMLLCAVRAVHLVTYVHPACSSA